MAEPALKNEKEETAVAAGLDKAETDEEKTVRMDARAKARKAWDESEEMTDEEKKACMDRRRAKDKASVAKKVKDDEPPVHGCA